MQLLSSNFQPLKTNGPSFSDTFYSLLPKAQKIDIAVGYITSDSIVELQKLVELNGIEQLNLTIGMHYLEKFTKVQYNAAIGLNDYLRSCNKGEVRLVTPFKYHGKLYSFSNNAGPFAGIIGSNNLGSIIENSSRTYESSALLKDSESVNQINRFIKELVAKTTKNISDCEIESFNEENSVLKGNDYVTKKSEKEIDFIKTSLLTDVSFAIPIKTFEDSPKSNLNAFFGKGRKGHNGLIKPRHWYEVELIVPKKITKKDGYPKSKTPEATFKVITDDGWAFNCKVSGQNSKNFRSEGDLRVLGKWLKGRLENADVLKVGEPVTNKTLSDYGRKTFTLTKTKIPDTWFIDFGV